MKNEFYLQVEKNCLFEEGYFVVRFGYSWGSMFDLMIVLFDSKILIYDFG